MMIAERSKTGSLLFGCCLCWFALVLLAGCGGSPEKVYPVEGTVTLDGTPVVAGTVQFEPFEPGPKTGKKHSARGSIDAEGHYQLTTFEAGDGAVLGHHHVTVIPMREWIREDRPSYVKVIPRDFSDEYGDPSTSGLEFEVKAGENTFDIPLSSDGP
jgi:hypothetical protein